MCNDPLHERIGDYRDDGECMTGLSTSGPQDGPQDGSEDEPEHGYNENDPYEDEYEDEDDGRFNRAPEELTPVILSDEQPALEPSGVTPGESMASAAASEAGAPHPFARLNPDFVLDAVESLGLVCSGQLAALNSYENRVYQIGIDQEEPVILKIYRPDRWSDAQILEEHEFQLELTENELPCVPPMVFNGKTLHVHEGFRFSLFRRRGGHAPDLDQPDTLMMLGRLLGQMHNIGSGKPFQHRPALTVGGFLGRGRTLIESEFLPPDLLPAYRSVADDLTTRCLDMLGDSYLAAGIRIHGDLHRGNILWRGEYFNLVDFDDARTAPPVQDIWMLLAGDRETQTRQLDKVLEGYELFRDFDYQSLRWIEALRTMRMMHHAGWIAERWQDPAFPQAFTWFNSPRYWSDHILQLREQQAALLERPLSVF